MECWRRISLIPLLLIGIVGCTSLKNNQQLNYSIKKGEHYSEGRSLTIVHENKIKFTAIFDSSCIYQLKNENQLDVNKLIGLADNAFNPRKNSARIGWRWNDQKQKIELLAYTHNNYQFSFKSICFVDIEKPIKCSIELAKEYKFDVNNTQISMVRSSKKENWHSLMHFYFGGNEVAPHNMKVKVVLNNP